jgi:hypothetical protein
MGFAVLSPSYPARVWKRRAFGDLQSTRLWARIGQGMFGGDEMPNGARDETHTERYP